MRSQPTLVRAVEVRGVLGAAHLHGPHERRVIPTTTPTRTR